MQATTTEKTTQPLFTPGAALEETAPRLFDVLNRIAEYWASSSENLPLAQDACLGHRMRTIEGEVWDVLSAAGGERKGAVSYPAEGAVAAEWGLHPDEAKPRAETFLHERKNWEIEVERLRAHIRKLEGRE
jgi:hypothetical protein